MTPLRVELSGVNGNCVGTRFAYAKHKPRGTALEHVEQESIVLIGEMVLRYGCGLIVVNVDPVEINAPVVCGFPVGNVNGEFSWFWQDDLIIDGAASGLGKLIGRVDFDGGLSPREAGRC